MSGGDEDAAIPFITVGDDGKFVLHEDAVDFLRSLKGKVAVVAMVGLYRTGKSYLLSQITGNDRAFQIGSTVKACTKGIWMWCCEDKSRPDATFLFLDTEGLSSTSRSESYDARIFSLALLLSSYFIYNSVGTIDGGAISKLSLVVNLTKFIHVRARPRGEEDPGAEFHEFFPNFLWVVRDFSVKLEKDGRRISARDYLEDALMPEDGASDAVEQKNAVRSMLRSFFPERDCVTMVRPVSDESQLADLARVPRSALRTDFRNQVDALRKRVWASAKPKSLYGNDITGPMLAELAEAYVTAFNDSGAPVIASAWDRVVDKQCEHAVEMALEEYVSRTSKACGVMAKSINPEEPKKAVFEEDELTNINKEGVNAATRVFYAEAVRDTDKLESYEDRLRSELMDEFERLKRQNADASMKQCKEQIDKLFLLAKEEMAHSLPGDLKSLTTQTLIRTYLRLGSDLQESFMGVGRGPAKYQVFAEATMEKFPTILLEWSDKLSSYQKDALTTMQRELTAKSTELALAESREKGEKDLRSQEKLVYEKTLQDQSRIAALEIEHLKNLVSSKNEELDRLSKKQDLLIAAFESEVGKYDERLNDLTKQLASARAAHESLSNQKFGQLEKAATLAEDLATSNARVAQLEMEVSKLRSAGSQSESVLREKLRSSEVELKALREQVALLTESVGVQKKLLAAKVEEKEEVEYQWGEAKGRLAMREADYGQLEVDMNILTELARKMKHVLVSTKKLSQMPPLDDHSAHIFAEL